MQLFLMIEAFSGKLFSWILSIIRKLVNMSSLWKPLLVYWLSAAMLLLLLLMFDVNSCTLCSDYTVPLHTIPIKSISCSHFRKEGKTLCSSTVTDLIWWKQSGVTNKTLGIRGHGLERYPQCYANISLLLCLTLVVITWSVTCIDKTTAWTQ